MDWDDHAAGWDDNPGVLAYATAVFRTLKDILEVGEGPFADLRVLDFGCGTGTLSEILAKECKQVVGLDASAKMVAKLTSKIEAHNWVHVKAVAGTLETALATGDLAASDDPFDLVVCSSVCAFLEDYPGTTRLLASLLRPGGLFVQFDWERDEASAEPFGLSRGEIRAAIRGAGLVDVRVQTGFEETVDEQTMKPVMGVGRCPV